MATRLVIVVAGAIAAAACTGNGPTESPTGPSPAPSVVTGTVTYRERIALPPDAVVDVWITDIGPGVVAQAILAEATVPAAGRQVPLPFEVRIDPARVQATRPYGLRAAIRAGGETWFATTAPVPVLTQGAPAEVTVMVTRAGSGVAAGASPSLVGTRWRLEDLAGAGVVANVEATLEFPEAGRVAGRGSCNRFFGTVTITGTAIRFGMLGATQMACPDPVGAQEIRYVAALAAAERFTLDGDRLQLFAGGSAAPLRFSRLTP